MSGQSQKTHRFKVIWMSPAVERFGCSEEVLTVAAMLQVQHVFTLPSRAKAQAVSETSPSPSPSHMGYSTGCE